MFFSVLLIAVGLGTFCALLYSFAIFALPFAVGLQAGLWAIKTGAGAIGGIAVGIVAGAIVLVVGQVIFSTSRSLLIRWLLILLFAGPAAVAGYSMVIEISELGVIPSPIWQQVFAIVGGLVISVTAIDRLAALPPSPAYPRRPTPARPHPRPTGLQKSMLLHE